MVGLKPEPHAPVVAKVEPKKDEEAPKAEAPKAEAVEEKPVQKVAHVTRAASAPRKPEKRK
jgi:hypothetical protein